MRFMPDTGYIKYSEVHISELKIRPNAKPLLLSGPDDIWIFGVLLQ